jgi:hypothetical protein
MLPKGLPANPGELSIFSRSMGPVHPTTTNQVPPGCGALLGESKETPTEEISARQGRPEASEKGGEQSYESMVPMKVGNRRAPARGGHGIHWRDGTNKPTYLPTET